MPAYKAIVMGQDFPFLIDEDEQLVDFFRTMYLEAATDEHAATQALARVSDELRAAAMLDEQETLLHKLHIDTLRQVERLEGWEDDGDFVWYLQDEEAEECLD
jgi:hypothetical protein